MQYSSFCKQRECHLAVVCACATASSVFAQHIEASTSEQLLFGRFRYMVGEEEPTDTAATLATSAPLYGIVARAVPRLFVWQCVLSGTFISLWRSHARLCGLGVREDKGLTGKALLVEAETCSC